MNLKITMISMFKNKIQGQKSKPPNLQIKTLWDKQKLSCS